MDDQTIQISGMGVISAAGTGIPDTLRSFSLGEVHAGRLTLFDTPLEGPVFQVPTLPPFPDPDEMRTLRLCRVALRQALDQARLTRETDAMRIGVCMGTTVACQLNDLHFYTAYRAAHAAPMTAVDRYLNSNLADAVARSIHASGPSATIVNACSSSADAIGAAVSWLRAGLCDIAVAGGADELNRVPLCGFHSLGIMSPEVCRPFDVARRGLNLGEGAAVLVLETREHARRRGAAVSPLSILGYGLACDAHHLTAPRPDGSGLESAIRIAMSAANVTPSDIAFVNAHGTATPDNDRVEGAVLARVFGTGLPFLSTKGYTGHTLGAAGAIEAVFTAAALQAGWIPPCAGFATPDPAIPIAPVSQQTPITGHCALSTSLAFGGNNAALIIGIDRT